MDTEDGQTHKMMKMMKKMENEKMENESQCDVGGPTVCQVPCVKMFISQRVHISHHTLIIR